MQQGAKVDGGSRSLIRGLSFWRSFSSLSFLFTMYSLSTKLNQPTKTESSGSQYWDRRIPKNKDEVGNNSSKECITDDPISRVSAIFSNAK